MLNKYTRNLSLFVLLFTAICTDAQYQYLGGFNNQGYPSYLVTPRDTVSVSFRNKIAATLPESRSVPVYNPLLVADARTETIQVNCNSDVWISFVDEGASFLNALGYYTFSLDTPLTAAPNPNKIKIIFPNASKSGSGGAFEPGDKVYLGNFPARTGIGFVLMADGWNGTVVTPGRWTLYSNAAFNPESDSTLKKHTVILKDTVNNRLVIGFEDIRRDNPACDNDFNDVLFFATVSPVNCVNKLDSIPILTDDGHIAFSGNTGGLESKGLGDKIAKRVFNKAKAGLNGDIDYKNFKLVSAENGNIRSNSVSGGLQLSAIMPTQILDQGYTAYITTPTDIPSITNAKEVRSIDFVQSGICKAVAFATKTLGVMYDHTKPICDRLKGASLLAMDNFNLKGLNFVRYTLQQEAGNIEYAMSFTIGKKAGRNSFSFQSNWLNKDYVTEDTLINYQVWGIAPYLCVDMTLDILDKLNVMMPVTQNTPSAVLPKTYIINGNRNGSVLSMTIANETNATSGYFEVEERATEIASSKTVRIVPFSMKSSAKTAVSFPMSDAFESNIAMYVGGKLQDVVYMSDGTWALDFDSTKTIIKNYSVTNDSARLPADEYPVFRNIQVTANTNDYVTAYKVLRGAGALQNLSDYKTISFKAKANGNLRITLVKNSITDFAKQYKILVPISTELKSYAISLSDFISAGNNQPINANDITTIVFSFEATGGVQTTIDATISSVAFSKKSKEFLSNLLEQQLHVYPNPVRSGGTAYAAFKSTENTNVTVKLIETATGKIVQTQQANAIKGDNMIPIKLGKLATPTLISVVVEGSGIKLKPAKIITN
ncbi:MAG: DUF4114 domain-containing protein [Sediminibacterium sp.]|nr:DUF4114 domain-containing protein [Sediminibacterium sp.]